MSNIPELRFKEFSREWETVKLGSLGSFQGGGTPTTSEEKYWIGDIPWISSSDIINGDIKNINISRFINETSIKESATKLIPKDSVLFVSRVGVGKLAIANTDLCTSQDFTNLTLKNDNSYFIGSYFLSKTNLLEKYSQGTSIKGFTTGDLKTLKLNLPSKQEQEKIASFLTSVDTKIEQLTKKEELLKQYKKGVMQKIFSQEIRFRADDGSEFPEWEEKSLGELVKKKIIEMSRGKVISKKDISEIDGNYPIYSSSVKNNGLFGFYGKYDFDEELITWSVDGGGDFFHRKKHKFSITNVSGYIRLLEDKLNYKYLALQLQHLHKKMSFDYQIKAHPSVISELYCINIPCIEEQTKIANFLSSIDKKIEDTQKQLEHTKTFKKGLLQQMFV